MLEHGRATYPPRVVTSASLEWLVDGYRRALARFTDTASARNARERFIPLFETLNWAVAVVDYSRKRGPQIESEIVRALRFARNRVHHQWADALEPRDVPFPRVTQAVGTGSRIVAPPTVVEWFWKPADQLPDPEKPQHEDPEGKESYEGYLQGEPVQHALDQLDSLLPPTDS